MLAGRLSDFGIFDVLQLARSRPGPWTLRLEGPDAEIALRFRDGEVVGLLEPDRPTRARLGARLRALSLIDDQTLGAALAESAREGRPLTEVFQTRYGVSPEHLAAVQRWHQTDRLLAPFVWPDGTYALLRGDESSDPPTPFGFGVDQLILEGFELHDAWPMVRRWVPSWDLCVERRRPRSRAVARGAPEAVVALEAAAWGQAEAGCSAGIIADRLPGPRTHARWALARLVARGDVEWAPL